MLRLCLVLLAIPAAASAARTGELTVRLGANGQPCFTVAEREEQKSGTPQFQSIVVSESAGHPMWAMALPHGRSFALSFRMCVPYGGRPPVLPQTPSMPLVAGKPYEVMVQAVPGAAVPRAAAPGATAPRQYHARFCLLPAGVAVLGAGRACAR